MSIFTIYRENKVLEREACGAFKASLSSWLNNTTPILAKTFPFSFFHLTSLFYDGFMYFVSFVTNLLAWTFIGIGLGFFLHKGRKHHQNLSIFLGGLSALGGGVFSSMTHGMFPEIGIDFFNLSIAFSTSLATLYIFAPNTRESISSTTAEVYSRAKYFAQALRTEQKTKSQYFSSEFWKNITSTL